MESGSAGEDVIFDGRREEVSLAAAGFVERVEFWRLEVFVLFLRFISREREIDREGERYWEVRNRRRGAEVLLGVLNAAACGVRCLQVCFGGLAFV